MIQRHRDHQPSGAVETTSDGLAAAFSRASVVPPCPQKPAPPSFCSSPEIVHQIPFPSIAPPLRLPRRARCPTPCDGQ
jgi:hypothetical protein